MICIILCAGYGTRLYPYTINAPKALLDVSGKPLLSYTLENLSEVEEIKKILIVTNDKFYNDFIGWGNGNSKIEIINDETRTNETRLGGVMDFALVLEKFENEDILILYGDNYFNFKLKAFVSFFNLNRKPTLALYDIKSSERAKRFGVLEISGNKIIKFEEKPANPKTTFISTGCYLFPKESIADLRAYIESNKNKEGIGYIVKDFIEQGKEIQGFIFDADWHDIGTIEDYERIKREIEVLELKRKADSSNNL